MNKENTTNSSFKNAVRNDATVSGMLHCGATLEQIISKLIEEKQELKKTRIEKNNSRTQYADSNKNCNKRWQNYS